MAALLSRLPRRNRYLLLALAWLVSVGMPGSAFALEIYVSPTGSDRQPATAAAPIQTIAAAQKRARARAGKEPVTILLTGGTYYLPETLILQAADSGTKDAPVTYAAVLGQTPSSAAVSNCSSRGGLTKRASCRPACPRAPPLTSSSSTASAR